MAFWGAPPDNPNHAVCAYRSALICQELIYDLCHRWEIAGLPPFKTRMGLHTDTVVVGNMGYEKRINYTVIGDGVNLASRLEGINKFYGTKIVMSESTYSQVKDFFEIRMLDRITVKGKIQPIHIYELLTEKNKLNDNDSMCNSLYENGLRCYFIGDWDRAIQFMEQVLA